MHQPLLQTVLSTLAQSNDDSVKWVIMGVGAFGLVYLMVLRPMLRKKKKDPLDRPAQFGSLSQQRAIERDMQNVIVEYEKMIRNMTAGIDTRAAKLEVLLREADEKIAALRAAGGTSAGEAGAPPKFMMPSTSDAPPPTDVIETKPAPEPTSGPDPRHAEVYALADQGLSAMEVARRLGRPNGEIELILALRGGNE